MTKIFHEPKLSNIWMILPLLIILISASFSNMIKIGSFIDIFILLGFMVFFLFVFESFSEVSSTFSRFGGFLTYFREAYARNASFVLTISALIIGNAYLIYRIIDSSSGMNLIFRTIYFAIGAVALCVVVFSEKKEYPYLILFSSGLLTIGDILIRTASNIFNLEITLPFVSGNLMHYVSFIFSDLSVIFVMMFLFLFPFSFMIKRYSDSEEEISGIISKSKIVFFISVILFAVVLDRSNSTHFLELMTLFLFWAFSTKDFVFILSDEKLHKKNINGPEKYFLFMLLFAVSIFVLVIFRNIIVDLIFIFSLIVIGLMMLGTFILRLRKPDLERPYMMKLWKMPSLLIFTITLVSLIISIHSMLYLSANIALALYFLIFVVLLFLIYIALELRFDENSISAYAHLISGISFFLEKIVVPNSIRDKMFKFLGNVEGKIILNIGCGHGEFTLDLLEKKAKVYATDRSKQNLRSLGKLIKKKNYSGFELVVDRPSSISPLISHANHVISHDILTSYSDIDQVLKEMNLILPKGGKIIFLEHDNLFGFIKNKWINDDNMIHKLFKDSGFLIDVTRLKMNAMDYVVISGIKIENAYYLKSWYKKNTVED